jgi:hypothetical protein
MLLTFIVLMTLSLVLLSALLYFSGAGVVIAVVDILARLLKYYFPVLGPLSMFSVFLLFLIVLIPLVTLCVAGLFVLRKIRE